MKRFLAVILAFCCGATLFAARGKTTPGGWFDDYAAAREKARRENKPMLLLFTGSDWCGFCVKLRKGALDKSDFKSFARKHLVLVYVDSPRRTELPPELVEQNNRLRSKFGAGGGVPNTLIVSPDERVVGRIGGCPRNPKDYLKRVRELVKRKDAGAAEPDARRLSPPPPPPSGVAAPDGWESDFEKAKRRAAAENRPLLLLLTGSDWCGFCIKLRQETLESPEFRQFAGREFVLCYADMPRNPDFPAELKARNRELMQRLNVRGVPRTVIFSPDGREIGQVAGWKPKDVYLQSVAKIINKPAPRVEKSGSPSRRKARGRSRDDRPARRREGPTRPAAPPEGWLLDFDAAKQQAVREDKPLLILFTGSDWCGFCVKLRKTVLETPEFKRITAGKLVLCYADMPRNPDFPAELKARNRELQRRFCGSGGVPHTVIVSPSGMVLGEIGGCPRDPATYFNKLRKILREARENPPPKLNADGLPDGWFFDPELAAARMRRENKPLILIHIPRRGFDRLIMDRKACELIRDNFVPLAVPVPGENWPGAERFAEQGKRFRDRFQLYRHGTGGMIIVFPPETWDEFEKAAEEHGERSAIHRVRRNPRFELSGQVGSPFFFAELEALVNYLAGKHRYTVPEGWTDDFDAARERSRRENRPLLMYFGGSDYNGVDIVMRREVLSTDKFRDFASREFVLFYADLPRGGAIPEHVRRRNIRLSRQYHTYSSAYFVVLMPDGRCIGFFHGYSKDCVKKLREILRDRDKIPPYKVPAGWTDDCEAALREAKRLNRPIMMMVLGSDWNWRSRIVIERFLGDPEFTAAVRDRYIPLYIDFPLMAQPPKPIVRQNLELQEKFRFSPTNVVIVSPEGGRLASVYPGYGDWRRFLEAVNKKVDDKR